MNRRGFMKGVLVAAVAPVAVVTSVADAAKSSTVGMLSKLNLLDWARQQPPTADIINIVEVLSETNEILLDAKWHEATDRVENLTYMGYPIKRHGKI